MPQSHVNGWASDSPTPAQIKEFFAQIESGRVTKENLQAFLRNQKPPLVLGANVVYDLSVEDLVLLGKYDLADNQITSDHFPSTEKGKKAVEFILVGFDRPEETDDIVYKLKYEGLRPATIKELLALGISHPRLHREMNIAALGSSWCSGGDDMVPCFMGSEDRRILRLVTSRYDWKPFWRFAAVKIK